MTDDRRDKPLYHYEDWEYCEECCAHAPLHPEPFRDRMVCQECWDLIMGQSSGN